MRACPLCGRYDHKSFRKCPIRFREGHRRLRGISRLGIKPSFVEFIRWSIGL